MEAPKDKRSKAYKDWVKAQKEAESTGLGDVVESITKVTGIKQVVKSVFDETGKDCGCDKRKEKLNKIRWNFKPVRCFTEEQYNWWVDFKSQNKNIVTPVEREEIRQIMIQLFARDIGRPSCCMGRYIDQVDKVFNAYQ